MTNPVLSAPLDVITTNVINLLKTTGRPVYDGVYGGNPTSPTFPYAIAYQLPGGNADATPDMGATLQTVTAVFQVTSVSNVRNQCQNTTRQMRDRLIGRAEGDWAYELAMPAGWVCTAREPDSVLPGVDRQGDPPTAIYSQSARYLLTFSPDV